jgi:hypothetical protein
MGAISAITIGAALTLDLFFLPALPEPPRPREDVTVASQRGSAARGPLR